MGRGPPSRNRDSVASSRAQPSATDSEASAGRGQVALPGGVLGAREGGRQVVVAKGQARPAERVGRPGHAGGVAVDRRVETAANVAAAVSRKIPAISRASIGSCPQRAISRLIPGSGAGPGSAAAAAAAPGDGLTAASTASSTAEFGLAHRLGEVAVEARGEATLAVALHRVRRQGDDRHPPAAGIRLRPRIAATASKPSITGICTSMSTTSNPASDGPATPGCRRRRR